MAQKLPSIFVAGEGVNGDGRERECFLCMFYFFFSSFSFLPSEREFALEREKDETDWQNALKLDLC